MAQNVFFKKGLLANLPESYSAGTFYVTTDERAMYLDIDDSTRIRLGDFIQVAAVANLPTAGASTSALYYCVAENILAKWNGTTWTQINKQPTADEMKTLLGLQAMAYKTEVAESDLNTNLAAKINDAYADAHTHANHALLDTYTQTNAALADAVAKKHEHANADELAKIVAGDKAKWDAVADDYLTSADKVYLTQEINKKVNKTDYEADKATFATKTEIAKLAGVSEGATKTEASETNGYIKIDGVETLVYEHPQTHSIDDVSGLQDALDGKSDEGHSHSTADLMDYDPTIFAEATHTHSTADLTDYDPTAFAEAVHGHDMIDINGLEDALNSKVDASVVGEIPTDLNVATVIEYIDLKTSNIASDATVGEISDRVTAIEEDYLVEADKTELAGLVTTEKERAEEAERVLTAAVNSIKDDYLTSVDKTQLTKAINDEAARAQGVEESLQTQINTIMSNPDAEGAINSINEFTAYINEHKPVAEAFRTDINKNKDDIAALDKALDDHEALAAETYETKADAEAKLTEAKEYADGLAGNYAEAGHTHTSADISNFESDVAGVIASELPVYGFATEMFADDKAGAAQSAAEAKAAELDAALKTELQAEIDADVKVVADDLAEYQASNDEEVAKKANAADVYAKSETFTKDEVNAAIAAAVEAAHTWGSF